MYAPPARGQFLSGSAGSGCGSAGVICMKMRRPGGRHGGGPTASPITIIPRLIGVNNQVRGSHVLALMID